MKNIIFDFGGVLLDLDYQKTYDRLSEVMGISLSEGKVPEGLIHVFEKFEKGQIHEENFIWALQNHAEGFPQARQIIDAWNAMLIGWNPKRLEMLLDLQKTYEVFLLSNTNALHMDWVYKDLLANHQVHHFDKKYFDMTFYSHKMGMRKPDDEIYLQVLKEADLNASETLFIDDKKENIEGAKRVGIVGQLHDPSTEIVDVIQDYLKGK